MLLLSSVSLGVLAFPDFLSTEYLCFRLLSPGTAASILPRLNLIYSALTLTLSKSKKNDFSVFAGQSNTFQFSIFCAFNYLSVYMARYHFNSISCYLSSPFVNFFSLPFSFILVSITGFN
jgi:hypothetical protein